MKTGLLNEAARHTRMRVAMKGMSFLAILVSAIILPGFTAHAQDATREQIKGLDEQVQEIKSDVLAIAAELNHLEERLLYPSNTQIAVFVSLKPEDSFLLDSLELRLNGETVAHHLYSYKELEALEKGGVQRIFTGNLRSGEHELQVTMLGQTKGGSELSSSETFTIEKAVGPKAVEVSLSSPGLVDEAIELKEL